MSHPCSFLSITAGYFTLEFPSLYETEDRSRDATDIRPDNPVFSDIRPMLS
jgi:hypothetical protein